STHATAPTAFVTISLHDALPISHRAEARLKSARASRKIRLVPQRSPNQPEAGMTTARLTRYATTTASIEVLGTPNWRIFLLALRSEEHTSELQPLRHRVCSRLPE